MSESGVPMQVTNFRYDAVWRCYGVQGSCRWIRGSWEDEGRLSAHGASSELS